MKIPWAILTVANVCFVVISTAGASFFVSLNGSDENPGTEALPWRTIGKAAISVSAGDTTTVKSGIYDERITTTAGGTSGSNRLVFRADGVVTMRGFVVRHPFVTIEGFDITGHSGAAESQAFVEIGTAGDNFEILSNTIRDGTWIIRSNLVFTWNEVGSDTISSSSGGFLAAGFRPGATLRAMRAAPGVPVANTGNKVIAEVSDTMLTLAPNETLIPDGPVLAYITGSFSYGIYVNNNATNGVVRSNVFKNLGFDSAYFGGKNNRFEDNRFERCNGWDALHYSGSDNMIRRNVILDSPWRVFQTSPDALENWSTVSSTNILIEENFVIGFDGAMGIQHIAGNGNGRVTFRRNVFVNGSRFAILMPDVVFENNTFLSVAASPSAVVAPRPHPLSFVSSPGFYSADGAIVQNNIFVGCGQGNQPERQGWYESFGVTNLVAQSNFVSGPAPEYSSKPMFSAGSPLLNGGDPGFQNINDPLGPDGVAFTQDDGLRLRADSKLRGAGTDRKDLGAYIEPFPSTVLKIRSVGASAIELSWLETSTVYRIQSSIQVSGEWKDLEVVRENRDGFKIVLIELTEVSTFFRLVSSY